MKTLTLEIPESVDLDVQEAKNLLAAKLYENGKLSSGQAAELAGHSKREFLEMLSDYGVSLFNLSAEDIENDLANACRYHL